MRALGFSRSSILIGFLVEAVVVAVAGGVLGCALALPANGLTTGTFGANFAELAFAFRTTPRALATGLAFAASVGALGGLPPALRAACRPITIALRED